MRTWAVQRRAIAEMKQAADAHVAVEWVQQSTLQGSVEGTVISVNTVLPPPRNKYSPYVKRAGSRYAWA